MVDTGMLSRKNADNTRAVPLPARKGDAHFGRVFFTSRCCSHQKSYQMMYIVMRREAHMRITVTLDDELLKEAEELTDIKERSKLIRDGLEALIQREAARGLARLGGGAPDIQPIPRRRPEPDDSQRHVGMD